MTQVDEGPESLGAPDVLTAAAPSIGELLAERYQLQQHINDDSFGRQVWRGIDVILRRPVAVVLRYPGGPSAVEMLDAAVTASRVTHSHLVDIYDAIDEGTRAYVVREWVDGQPLRDAVRESPLDPERATTVAASIASAVAALHASGMVHGNVHPGTVLIGVDGRVLLSDARVSDTVTPDTDVRAVGAVLYAALTGHWPHAEAGRSALPDALRDATGAPVAPRQVRGGMPGHLSDLAVDLLDPQVPLPSADVLAADLGRLDAEHDTEDDHYLPEDRALSFNEGLFPAAGRAEPHRPVGRKLAVGIAGLLVLAVVGLMLAAKVLPGSGNAGSNSPATTPSSAAARAGGQARQLPLTAGQVRVVDPGGDRTELDGAANVVDHKADTVWKTQTYTKAPFGGVKPGMGILIDLGSAQTVSEVKVDFLAAGATVDIRAGTDTAPNTSAGDQQIYTTYKIVSPAVVSASTHDFVLSSDEPAGRYLLVWISVLAKVDDNPLRPYQAGIAEISVFVNS